MVKILELKWGSAYYLIQLFASRKTQGTNQYLLFLKVCGNEKSCVPPNQHLGGIPGSHFLFCLPPILSLTLFLAYRATNGISREQESSLNNASYMLLTYNRRAYLLCMFCRSRWDGSVGEQGEPHKETALEIHWGNGRGVPITHLPSGKLIQSRPIYSKFQRQLISTEMFKAS